jgi:hypothetical protein
LKDLAEASADNHKYGQAIARPPARRVNGKSSCWEEKSIHEATRKGLGIEGRRWKDRIRSVQGCPLSSILHARSFSKAFVDESSIHSQVQGSNFMTTEELIANLNTIIDNQNIIKENQEIIKANQEKLDALLANQETIQANQTKILANQSEIISLLSQ